MLPKTSKERRWAECRGEGDEIAPRPLRRRRRGAATAAATSRRISRLWYSAGAFFGAAAIIRVEGQYTDGGQVSVECGRCNCDGTSDDGSVMVFDNPSSGERIAGIGGEYSEIAETSCGTSAFAVGSTIYELDGVDLESRDLEAIEMSATTDCTVSTAPSSADCYTGNTAMSLDGGVSMTMTVCLCIDMEDTSTVYKSKVSATVQGASAVDIPSDEMETCLEGGFVSQLVAAVVEGETYLYNFDLAVSGEDSSADLSVASAPNSAAQSFICGELEPTPSPVTPTPPTPQPTAPPPDPTSAPVTPIPPTPVPTEPPPDPTPTPVTPLPPPTSAPVTPLPPPTPAPIIPLTPGPTIRAVEPTATPVAPPSPAPTLPPTPGAVAAPTPGPIPPATPLPTSPPATAEPTPAAIIATPGPLMAPTANPPTGSPVLQPGDVVPTSSPSGGTGGVTAGPSPAGSVPATLAPLGTTAAPTPGFVANETASPIGFGPGSATSSPSAVGGTGEAGPTTPAPTMVRTANATAMPSSSNPISDAGTQEDKNLSFEDKPLTIGGAGLGVDAEVVALAVLAFLTFFPVCVK